MDKFWILIFMLYFATNSFDKSESVDLFDEIFGEGWWDNDKAKEWDKLTLEHNFHHEIDQIEPNSTDQNPPLRESDLSGQIEPNSTDQLGQIEPNSTDQNPPLTESDHSGQIELNSTEKRKIIDKFHAIKDKFKQKGKYSAKEWVTIEMKIAKNLKANRTKIFEWKKALGISGKMFNEKKERKHLVEKFDQMKAELTREGFKNSYKHEIDENVAKELCLSLATIYNWKSELSQTGTNYSDNEKLEIVKKLIQIESAHSGDDKKSCKEIVERFGVNVGTIKQWKKEFGLSRRNPKNERKNLVEKFDQRKAELKRDGFKSSYHNQINQTVAKELGLGVRTIYTWKRELGQTIPKHMHSHSEQKELMKQYYEIKGKTPKISDVDIAKMLKIGKVTLCNWKKQFKRQQLDQNSVDGHSVEVNAAANVQEIGNSNSGSI